MARKKSSSRKRNSRSELDEDVIAAFLAVQGMSDEPIDLDHYPPSERPESCPRGYEWLPDAFKRDIEPHGPDAREQVRQALAEDDFKAMLRTKIGKRYEIDPRMWDKEPLAQKVYPRFKDGRMRMRLKLYGGPYVSGWVFVPEGALTNVVNQAVESPQGVPKLASQSSLNGNRPEPAPSRRFSEAALREWYVQYVKDHAKDERPPSRENDWAAARMKFGDGLPRDAVRALRRELAPAEWKKGGHPKSGGRKHGGK